MFQRSWARPASAVALLALVLLASACLVEPSGDPGAPPEVSPGSTVPGEQEDGTMSIDEFQRDVQGAVEVAEAYWEERVEGFRPIRRVIAYQRDGEVECGGQPLTRNNAAYCSGGDFIAYDVNWAVSAFRQIGDAFVFYLLGHEYAHGIQVRLGIQYRFTIQQELQADCMAGAYMGDSVRAKALRLDDGDIDELQQGLLAVGDDPGQPWFESGAHGTAEQRADSFFSGYQKSLDTCSLG
ncbi:neutral zinc metallopeptidase [Micromonospora sp. CPCC 206061]|uniref:neutral zinc metallopeptidase n=1 Tax=Micromonospora sp. CPCC 206061 TaxID=3122410 RepID=UPI002FF11712